MVLMLLMGVVGYQSLSVILLKLRFVEIADDLNAGFLEMRLAEKNYFLYADPGALGELEVKLGLTLLAIDRAAEEIAAAIGPTKLEELRALLNAYRVSLAELPGHPQGDGRAEAALRSRGQELREFSAAITVIERQEVNRIIASARRVLFVSFGVFFLLAFAVSHAISQRIVRSLRAIEALARSISLGNFQQIGALKTDDELDAVVAAINSMSEELEHREEQIVQTKKLASIGVLTAGVTHELTNPVNNISMIAQAFVELQAHLAPSKQLEMVSQIEEETERIRRIIKNLLDFSKPQGTHLERSDLNQLVTKTLPLVQNQLTVSNIELKLTLAEPLPAVYVDEHQLQQVLVNLVVNAVQAMAPGGHLTISSRLASSRVELSVQDDGKGIAPEHLPQIFDPFFSTKGVDGTGLGLSVSYGIIKNLHGDIRVESRVGGGTTFIIGLPMASAA
jgi:signal transduction histidine kinase